MSSSIQKITTCLWFEERMEEAVDFYLSIFKDAKVSRKIYYSKEGKEIHGFPEGAIMTIEFELAGRQFMALNGGPQFKFTEAVSFLINCESQEEIDYYWDRLTEGGDEESQVCGWLKDKFGVSWQVSPIELDNMMSDSDSQKVERVTKAMLQMKKLDLAELRRAYAGE